MKPYRSRLAVLSAAACLGLGISPSYAQVAAPAAEAREETTVKLDPFSVSADSDVGFVAASSLAGGRISTALKDTPVAFSVITKEFLDAFNITNIAEASNWTTNANYTIGDSSLYGYGGNEAAITRLRGVVVNSPTRNFFPYNSVSDAFDIDRVDYARGANAVLFGAGGAGGTQNTGTKQALSSRNVTEARVQIGSWNKYRFTADVNRVVTDKLAVRANLLWSDVDNYRDRLWEEKQGFHFAGTYKLGSKLTVRGEFEYLKISRVANVYQYRDHISAWDGKTYDNYVSGVPPTTPNAATLAQWGVGRFPQRFVTRPDYNGQFLNFQNKFRTRGLQYNASAPSYFQGQPIKTIGWSVVGEAMIDGKTGISDTARYANSLAGSPFFTVPGRTVTPLWNDPHHQNPINAQLTRDSALYLTYTPFKGFFAEVAGDTNKALGFGDTANRRGMQEYLIDIVRTLPDGTANPWFLHPYQERGHYKQGRETDRDSLRVQSVYVKDTRFGKFQVGFMGGITVDTVHNRSSELMLPLSFINPDPRGWVNNGELNEFFLWDRFYDDDTSRIQNPAWNGPSRPGTAVDPVTGVRSIVTPFWMWDARREDNVYDSKRNSKYLQWAGNFDLFKNRLVVIGAFRRDFINFSQNRIQAPGDLPAGWDGSSLRLRQPAPADYNTLTFLQKDATGRVTNPNPIPADTRPRVSINGAAQRLAQYANDRFRDDFDSQDVKTAVNTGTLGGVINVTKWLGIFANQSTTFTFGQANQTVWNKFLPPTSSQGKDAGIRVTLPNNRLSFSAGWYRAFQKGASAGVGIGNTISDYNAIGDLAPVGDLTGRNVRNFARFRTNNIVSSATNDTKGYEFEMTANLRPNWRLILNYATCNAATIDAFGDVIEFFKHADPTVRQILADGGVIINPQTKQASINPAVNDPTRINQTVADAAVNGWNDLVNSTIPNTEIRGKQRVVASQSVPWTANVATDYRLRAGPLQGLRLGLGVNLRGPQNVGSRVSDTIRDPNNPALAIDDPKYDALSWINAKGYYTTTGTMSYIWRLKDSRRYFPKTVQFDFSIDNLLNRRAPIYGSTQGSHNTSDTVFVPNDGTLSDPSRRSVEGNFTILNPRNFTLSAKMDF
ncbi:MAG: Plug domain-containing protein [Opitutus sp.]|nr:Plug domain-containing protein [Opitutus sp.]